MSHAHSARAEWKDFKALAPEVDDLVRSLGGAAAQAGLDKQLLELVKLRASQINRCAFCVQFHILAAEELGVATDKLNLVVVWREAPIFSVRERAALAWTEALTLLTQGVSDEVYAEVSSEFSEKQLAYLSSARSMSGIDSASLIAGHRRRGRRGRWWLRAEYERVNSVIS